MSFASDIQTKTLTDTGTAVNGRSRLAGVYYIQATTTPATLTFRDGGASGTVVLTLPTPGAVGANDLMIPDNGILCSTDIHVTISSNTDVTSCMVMFVGGKAA